ncbi:unannotated protein [freshwater metagenome]|uniref:Unannotated protein n=1 Tax=freshwater metagenome TaxID=449393 RepID=A0A6J6PYY6_9ZZZZ
MAAGAGVERRELVAALHQHGHPQRLEGLQRQPDVEDALHPGTDHGHVGAAELGQVGRDVEALLRPAVHAAEAAGHEGADAGEGREAHGGGDGGGAVHAAGDDVRQVAHAHLGDIAVAGEQLEARLVETDARAAAEHRDGRRHGAVLADDALDLDRHGDVLRIGHAVADDRALEGDDRTALGERGRDLVLELEQGVRGHGAPSLSARSARTVSWLATVRAAARWPYAAAAVGAAPAIRAW